MKLELFKLIDKTLNLYQHNYEMYQEIEKDVIKVLKQSLVKEQDCILGLQSRIKTKESLREKIVRNRYYVTYHNEHEILNNLSDVVGCLIECRFLKDEQLIFEKLQATFNIGKGKYRCSKFSQKVYLDAITIQPQFQKNGLAIYRLDGYYIYNDQKINFELQIKSLVNSFWGSIEHKLVYKNNNYLDVDDFMGNLLVSINQSLNVLDYQLNIVHDQIQELSRKDIEFNEKNLEIAITKAINDLFSMKMKDSLGFSLSIKYTSKILANYIFNYDIIPNKQGEDKIITLIKMLRRASLLEMDFEQKIEFIQDFTPDNHFQAIFGQYLITKMNEDYDWYIFFKMLTIIEQGNYLMVFVKFLIVLQDSLIEDYWLKTSFTHLAKQDAIRVQEHLLILFAKALQHKNSIQIVDSDTAEEFNKIFRHFVLFIETECHSYDEFMKRYSVYEEDWKYIAHQILNTDR